MAGREGVTKLQLCLVDMLIVDALFVIYSELLICCEFTKNGLHGLCGLHANHRVWQERGITSEALVCYGSSAANSQDY